MFGKFFFSYLLLFFGGTFGLHRFFLERWWTGLVYALTGGILGLGVLFDFFALPFMIVADERQ
tara:strand:- start:1452 stop:1640 length:189 start_codon:yes stop_codon:yes gene_type:complete